MHAARQSAKLRRWLLIYQLQMHEGELHKSQLPTLTVLCRG